MGTLVELAGWHCGSKSEPSTDAPADVDPWPLGLILWMGSVLRVACGWVRGEVFGTELFLAIACVAVVPWLVFSDRDLRVRRMHGSANPDGPAPGRVQRLEFARVKPAPSRRPSRRVR